MANLEKSGVEYVIESKAALKHLKNLDAALEVQGKKFKEITSSAARYNAKGKATSLIIRGLTQDNKKFAASIDLVNKKTGRQLKGRVRGLSVTDKSSVQKQAEKDKIAAKAARDKARADRDKARAIKDLERAQNKAAIAAAKHNRILEQQRQKLLLGSRSAKEFSLSFNNVVRLLQVQLLHSLIGRLVIAIQQATDEATKFSRRVGEIQSISQSAAKETGIWSNELRSLSRDFALDTLDTAEGAYQALSNQVVNASNSFSFLQSSANLSLSTVSTLSESVNTLSSILNAYSESTLNATFRSAQLFKTVELGRVRLGELANNIGNVSALSASLNISLADQNAAIVALTRQGIRFETASTLINNVMLKILKPTEELSKFFNNLGFESGEAAVKVLGLRGVLKALGDEANKGGGTTLLAKLLGRLRALRGIVGLTNNINQFDEALRDLGGGGKNVEEITKSIDELFRQADRAKELTRGTLGFKVEKLFGEIKVSREELAEDFLKFIVQNERAVKALSDSVKGLGSVFLDLASAIAIPTRGLANFIGLSQTGPSILGALASSTVGTYGAFLVFNKTLTSGTQALITYADTFSQVPTSAARITSALATAKSAALGLSLGIGAAILAVSLYRREQERLANIVETTVARIRKATKDLNEERQRTDEKRLAREKAIQDFTLKGIGRQLVAERELLSEGIKTFAVLEQNAELISGLGRIATPSFKDLFGGEVEVDPKDKISDLFKRLTDSVGSVKKLKEDISSIRFDKSLRNGLDVLAEFNKATNLEDITKLGDIVFQKTEGIFEKANDNIKEAKQNIEDIRRTLSDDVFDSQLEGKTGSQKIDAIRGRIGQLRGTANSATSAEDARQALNQIDNLAKKLIQEQSKLNSKFRAVGLSGGGVDTNLLKQNAAERIKIEQKFIAQNQSKAKAAADQLNSIDDKRIAASSARLILESNLQVELQNTLVANKSLVTLQEKQIENQRIITEQLSAQTELVDSLSGQRDEARKSFEGVGAEAIGLAKKLGDVGNNLDTTSLLGTVGLDGRLNAVLDASTEFEKLRKLSVGAEEALSTGDFEKSKDSIFELANQLLVVRLNIEKIKNQGGLENISGSNGFGFLPDTKLVDIVSDLDTLTSKLNATREAAAKVRSSESRLSELNAEIESRDKLLKTNKLEIKALEDINTKEKGRNEILKERLQIREKLLQESKARGFALGGRSRDTQMARLERGERVMSARTTRQFSTQLASMGAGLNPQTSSSTEININNSFTSGNPRVIAREIAGEIRREMRRSS